MSWRLVALACLALSGCSTVPRTEIIVIVDADPGVRADSDRVRVVVLGGDGTVTGPTAERLNLVVTPGVDGVTWPLRVAIAPLNDQSSRVYNVSASALAPGAPERQVATVRGISGFLPEQTLELHLRLEDACRGVPCTSEQTCRVGVCVSASIDPRTLLDDASTPADVGGASDATASDASTAPTCSAATEGMSCGPTSYTNWGACQYSDTCVLDGFRERTRIELSCHTSACEGVPSTERDTTPGVCARVTEMRRCFPTGAAGAWACYHGMCLQLP